MAYTNPDATDFKNFFVRDFPYGNTSDTVQDSDIDRALGEAGFNINPAFAQDQAQYDMLYLYLTAHYLVMDLRASSQGIAGNYNWLTTSKTVGSVSESFQIPELITRNPYMSMLSKTYYGAKYLNLIMPQIVGQIFTVAGATQP